MLKYLFVTVILIGITQPLWSSQNILNAYELDNYEQFLHKNGYSDLVVASGWEESEVENISGPIGRGPTKGKVTSITTLNCHSKKGGKAIVILGRSSEFTMDIDKWDSKTGIPHEVKSSPIKILKVKRFPN